MSDAYKIVSNAFNFGQKFSIGVNTRTGMFQIGITLGRLGDTFELKAGYSHLSVDNEGFGLGWSLNVSRYDSVKKRLTLSDGRSYQVTMSPRSEVACQYLKLQDLKVTQQNDVLNIIFKDGTVEQFDINGSLRSVTSPSGHVVTFTYKNGRLERITNQSNLSLALDYSESSVIITDSNGFDKVQVLVSERLTAVILPDRTSYRIGYRDIHGLFVIEYLYHPTGATEKLTYDESGMCLPAAGPVSSLPAVIMHETYGTDVPRMMRHYRYSNNNFLGCGQLRYSEDVDNLFETESNYTYSCTEVFGRKEITQTFNKYHLLIEERMLARPKRHLMKKMVVEYYADTRKAFSLQPDQYLLPRKETVTYYNLAGTSRSEVTRFEYDCYGNALCKVDVFGIETLFVYYPAAGEHGAAPAALAGIPSLLKSQIITPSIRKLQGGQEAMKSTFTYELHPSLQRGKSYPVKVKEYTETIKGRKLLTTSFTYVDDPSVPEAHGALLRTETSEGEWTKKECYSYSLRSGVSLTSVKTCTFADGVDYTEVLEICLRRGLPLSAKDRLGNQTIWEYDGLGRVTKEVKLAGSEYEKTTIYSYAMGERNRLEIEVLDGARFQVFYDQLGREIANYATDSYGNLVQMNQQCYNAQGQPETLTLYDDFGDGVVSLSTFLVYDVWNEVSREDLPDHQSNVTERDKANNSETRYTIADGQRSAAVTTYYNERGEVVREVRDEVETSITYNGFGLELKHANHVGVETIIGLDDIGRAVREQIGTVTTRRTFTNDNRELVTELSVAGTIVSSRQYDPLNRITSETRGGLVTRSCYNTLLDKPSTVILPSGDAINYSHSLVLGEVIGMTTSDDRLFFAFDANGQLVKASNNATLLQCAYYPNGLLKSESMSNKTASYTYSRQGKLLSITDYMGNIELRSYDNFQRLQTVMLGQTTVTLSYDTFGRLQQEHITSPTNPILVHRYGYDLRGRLTYKRTTSNGVHCLAQAYTYDKGMRLASKTITDASGSSTREEYRYDELGRLIEVCWSGNESPDYLGIGAMRSQSFTFDGQGNITEMYTVFTHGSEQGFDLARYDYNNGRLLSVSHSFPGVPDSRLTYDDNGNLSCDEEGRRYSYNVLGQLVRIEGGDGALLSAYTYSANGLQVKHSVPGQPDIELFYGLGDLLNESQGMVNSRILIVGGRPVSRMVTEGGVVTETSLVTDYKGSVLREVRGQTSTPLIYTPYGEVTGKTSGSKRLMAVTPYPGAEQEWAIYYWSDGGYSIYYIPGKRFNMHHGASIPKVITNWPMGKQLTAVTAHPEYAKSWHIYYWSDGSYSTYKVASRRFYVLYDADAAKVISGWPAGKVLAVAVTAWGAAGYEHYFWCDGSYSDVDTRSNQFTHHYADTSGFKGWGWPDGKRLVTVVSAWDKPGFMHYYWHDGSSSEFDTAKRQFITHHAAMPRG